MQLQSSVKNINKTHYKYSILRGEQQNAVTQYLKNKGTTFFGSQIPFSDNFLKEPFVSEWKNILIF